MEIRVNRIGRAHRYGTGNGVGGGGSPPPGGGDESGNIDTIGADTVAPTGVNAQVNCTAAHNLVNGQQVLIAGNAGVTDYNGTHAISVSGATTFEIPIEFAEIGTGGTWTLV